MDWENILSAFIGSLFGCFFSLFIYWLDKYLSSKRRLIDYLLFLMSDVHWEKDDVTAQKTWKDTLTAVWELYNSVYAYAPIWNKTKLGRAWEQYKGEDKDIIKKCSLAGDSRHPPQTKKEFIVRIKVLLNTFEPKNTYTCCLDNSGVSNPKENQ